MRHKKVEKDVKKYKYKDTERKRHRLKDKLMIKDKYNRKKTERKKGLIRRE